MKEICNSQASALTFFRCGGQIHKHVNQISSGFCTPTVTKVGLFRPELCKKWTRSHFFEAWYSNHM